MERIDPSNLEKLEVLNNKHILKIVDDFVSLCKPAKITVITDSKEDIEYCRLKAIEIGEEAILGTEGHSIHYDGFYTMSNHDQARDKKNTRVLIPKGEYASPWINTIDREEGLEEIMEIMDGCMKGRECLIRFFCLGPKNSVFSILALQMTDSFYVAHSEDLLYRSGYEEFKKLNGSNDFFYFIHSGGKLAGNPPVTEDLTKRRIYVDLQEKRVLSCFNQYAGNSLGLKKLALRLAIHRSNNEDWLAEHYFILGIHPKGKNRVTYACGAYPSGCGKTSTAMLLGQTILGDDIAYLRKWEDGYAHAVNIERGIFGIIKDVNSNDDPVIFKAITTPRETIFSNVLIKGNVPYWIGDGRIVPEEGVNFSGNWRKGKKDVDDIDIPHAHPNARYTIRIEELANADPNLHNPKGVPINGIFYGGRDSDTMPPVVESLDWEHGVFLGATIESETTAQTLGAEGIRKAQPMANLDFIVVPLAKYFENHQKFGNSVTNSPKVFAMNYFLKGEDDKYLNGILDKLCWVIWAEGRTHGDFDSIKTPIGYIPKYKDLRNLFSQYLNKDYKKNEYIEQFTLRIERLLQKNNRMRTNYEKEINMPSFFWRILNEQKSELTEMKKKFKIDEISPFEIAKKG
ncbi:MAG: phosphoenolpyruvate carboxykinase (GTP) [Promethearchaeota archaeon]|jgi:phosphoenolpyruvate carboxykinase (GTP)